MFQHREQHDSTQLDRRQKSRTVKEWSNPRWLDHIARVLIVWLPVFVIPRCFIDPAVCRRSWWSPQRRNLATVPLGPLAGFTKNRSKTNVEQPKPIENVHKRNQQHSTTKCTTVYLQNKQRYHPSRNKNKTSSNQAIEWSYRYFPTDVIGGQSMRLSSEGFCEARSNQGTGSTVRNMESACIPQNQKAIRSPSLFTNRIVGKSVACKHSELTQLPAKITRSEVRRSTKQPQSVRRTPWPKDCLKRL